MLTGLLASGAAVAQTAECQRYRAELASLGRERDVRSAAERQRIEIARLSGYYQSIGCGQGGFFFMFGPPPECSAIAQRINMMQATYARLASQAAYASNDDARRRSLMAAIQRACNPQREADEGEISPRKLGGGRLVCVRACDGSFFPLQNVPANGRAGADEMCQALCPAAETAAYRMPSDPDADLTQAVSLRGKPYVKLAAAFKYQKTFDPSCSCRKEGQSWVEALAKAEKMIEHGRGEIIVTAKKAEELSRPKLVRKPGTKPSQVAAKPLDVETTGSVTPAKADAQGGGATTRAQSSGIGPQTIESEKPLDQSKGDKREETSEGGAKRAVRVVGPAFIALPQTTSAE